MTGPISYTAMNENGVMSPTEKNGKIPTCHTRLPDTVEDDEETGELCGWGSIQPKICQRFRRAKWVLFWLSMAGAVQVSQFIFFLNHYIHKSPFFSKINFFITAAIQCQIPG